MIFANFSNINFFFTFFSFNFSCYYCSIDIERQSERSEPRPYTSSLVKTKDHNLYQKDTYIHTPLVHQLQLIRAQTKTSFNRCVTDKDFFENVNSKKFKLIAKTIHSD